MPEGLDGLRIRRHRVVREVARHHRAEPATLLGDAVVASLLELRLYLAQGRTHAVAPRVAAQQECSPPRPSADEREPDQSNLAKARPV